MKLRCLGARPGTTWHHMAPHMNACKTCCSLSSQTGPGMMSPAQSLWPQRGQAARVAAPSGHRPADEVFRLRKVPRHSGNNEHRQRKLAGPRADEAAAVALGNAVQPNVVSTARQKVLAAMRCGKRSDAQHWQSCFGCLTVALCHLPSAAAICLTRRSAFYGLPWLSSFLLRALLFLSSSSQAFPATDNIHPSIRPSVPPSVRPSISPLKVDPVSVSPHEPCEAPSSGSQPSAEPFALIVAVLTTEPETPSEILRLRILASTADCLPLLRQPAITFIRCTATQVPTRSQLRNKHSKAILLLNYAIPQQRVSISTLYRRTRC